VFYLFKSCVHDKLLDIFLTVDDGSEGIAEKALLGVRKAQVILACHYLIYGAEEPARKIQLDFGNEPYRRLLGMMKELQNVSSK
jgi:hypothetical protein